MHEIDYYSTSFRILVLSLQLIHSTFPASCRLYTEEYFINEMPAEGIPEMQRSNLVTCVIQVIVFVIVPIAVTTYGVSSC